MSTASLTVRMLLHTLGPFALGYFMSYLLRAVNQVIAPDLIHDFDLGQGELGQLTAAYLLAFVLFQLPLGILLDRFGPRLVQLGLLSVAAMGVLMFAMAETLWGLTLARGIIGLGLSGSLMACFKANALWLPMARVPLGNSSAVAMGALGLLAATEPADYLAQSIGWRAMFWCLAGVLVLVVLVIYVAAPRGGGSRSEIGWRQQASAQRRIFSDPRFWRIAPMIAAVSGAYIAIQSLWAGRFLSDAAGLERGEAAHVLLWMAGGFAAGSLFTGLVADIAQRHGIGLKAIIGAAIGVFTLAQVLIIAQVPVSPIIAWTLFGLSGQGANLGYATLAEHFGRELAGRAQSAANLILFLGATSFQWGIGLGLDYFPANHPGAATALGYQITFLAVLLIQMLAAAWYLMDRTKSQAAPRPLA